MKAVPADAGTARFAFMVEDGTVADRARRALLARSSGPAPVRCDRGLEGAAALRGRSTDNGTPGYVFELRTAFVSSQGSGKDRIQLRVWHIDPRSNAEVMDYENTGTPDGGAGSAIDTDALRRAQT